jgi:uncharacterized protein (TIGR03000 family)
MMVPDKMIPEKKKEPEKIDPPSKEDVAAPATVVVNLPGNAKLLFDGKATISTSEMRTFVSPDLAPKKTYTYTLTAEVVQNGSPVRQTKEITVRAGQETRVQFDFAPTSVVTTNVSAKR